MDTAAYLTNQGWRGEGHALYQSGRGITRPILVSQKQNVLGLGKKKHDAHADQWWARAFDATLKGINSTKDGVRGKTEGISLSASAQALQMVGKGGAKWVGQRGLYSNFVRGECLGGTLTPQEERKPDGNERNEEKRIDRDDEPRYSPSTNGKKKSKRPQQREETAEDSNMMGCQSAMQTTLLESTQTMIVSRGTMDERRQRREERQARRALDDRAPCQCLPANTEAKLDKDLRSRRSKRRNKEKLIAATRMESAVSKDIKPSGSKSKFTKKKRKSLADCEKG